MKEYLDMVKYVMENGIRCANRTGIDTIESFAYFYKVDLAKGYPLLTTKKMYFNSMVHELFWYLSGEEHIRNLRDHTKIWNDWSNDKGELATAYGRFWRRFPVPEKGLPGEWWGDKWTSIDPVTGGKTLDQIQYAIDKLKELKVNPTSRQRRRIVVSAWHPGNAAESWLPPCHYSFVFNVKGDKLNCHLTQRSCDLALGVPFNLGCYSLLTLIMAKECGYEPGEFAHTLVDAHIYVNQIEGLKEQLTREPRPLPTVKIADKPLFDLKFEDITLENYDSHPAIKFEVAV